MRTYFIAPLALSVLLLGSLTTVHAAVGFLPRLNGVKLSSLQVHPGDAISAAYEFQ
jgi:hypothetical protein